MAACVMSIFNALHFVRPWWFFAVIPFFFLLWLFARGKFSGKSWEKVCDVHLLPFMLLGRTIDVGKRSFLILASIAGMLGIIALAGPAWERLPQPVLRDDAALIVVFDLSLSMNAVDFKPNRLVRARFKISDLLSQRGHGQTGLVVYARDAFSVVPITDDTAAIELYLQSLDTSLMPRQGSRADLGLQEASALLQKINADAGDVLLVTDYADARVLAQARQLNEKKYKVSVLGIGTEDGGPISLPSGEFLSHKGEVVVPQLADAILNEVAQAGGGIYVQFDPFASSDVEKLGNFFKSHASSTQSKKEGEATADVWREEGPWLILLMLPIVAFGFRRGLLAVAVFSLVQPNLSYALDWSDLWLRPDQQGARVLERGEAEQAAELFESKEWKATAQYRNGDFSDAVETLENLDGVTNWYNKGNALVGAGNLQAAVEAYRHAVEIDPTMEDAIHNLGVVEELIKQMQVQKAQQSDEEGDGESQQNASAAGNESNEDNGEEESDSESGEEKSEENEDLSENSEADEADDEGDEGEDGSDSDSADASSPLETLTEKDQAIEQWLRGVPDNPGRLLKRKLKHLSRKKKDKGRQGDKPW